MTSIWRLTVIVAAMPAYARGGCRASGGGDAGVLGVIGALLMFGLILLKVLLTQKPTSTHPDGTSEKIDSGPVSETQEPAQKTKRQIGATTISFNYINQRHAAVNDLKERYGNSVRIVHRGKKQTWQALTGYSSIYTLIIEVPVKCPKCKETFSMDDFGEIDCPSCGAPLLVYFDERTRKKTVHVVSEAMHSATPIPASVPRETPQDPTEGAARSGISNRFSKIE